MNKSLLTRISYSNGLWMVGVSMLLFSVIGNIFYFAPDQQYVNIQALAGLKGQEIFGLQIDQIFRNGLFIFLFRFLLLFGSALLLQYISSEFRLIRVRSFFPFFLFCVFSATVIPVIPMDGASISCFLFCWSCLRLFAALEPGNANRAVFDASVLLAVASLFQCRIILILPVFLLVMGILQIFSLKSFFASIIGALSIFWMVGCVSFLMDDYSFLQFFSKELLAFKFVDFSSFSPAEMAYTSFFGVLMISAMLSFLPKQHLDKLRTRNYLNSVLLLWFSLLILWLFSGNNMGLLLFLFCLSSLMAAHFFSLIDTMYSRVLFFIYIFLSVFVYFLF
ncbi:MAG: DUF6427 family protein [Bacteroidales bacterium]|nr:DUF6427 family protein [Bacteroidales bacterium]